MNLAAALLYPIALLLPAAGAVDSESKADDQTSQSRADVSSPHFAWPDVPPRVLTPEWPFAVRMLQSVEPQPGWQVHIEQRVQIRISPRAPAPMPPDMFVGIPEDDFSVHFSERKIGKCLPVAGIAGVRPDRGNRLLLYMRDRRLIAAELERSCRARDFYSGFYLAKTSDGKLCVDRDTLLSRNGMNCKLTRVRQLVQTER
ncbi:hypothetical protein LK12_08800 [Novosphingobium malaysiense]|uniref:Uncharacterized protein n=1 Tax=Novosphingobium malaysiense TaxID=1348853 RepID=A0A0B1ZPB6_9SPHN|nr:hypothetical protein LK12_08800 [Novosphingobium malaysiense]